MKLKFLTALAAALSLNAGAQDLRVQPEFWYSGFQDNTLQLLIYGDNVSRCKASVTASNTTILSEQRVDNKNYLFLNLKVGSPENFEILLQDSTVKKNKRKIAYEIKQRTAQKRGFSDRDLMYMLMPDRFANGDPNNDNMPGMLEKANNSDPNGRHGGDIKGIDDHIDYLRDLGVTAVWINPILENNMPAYSYHGYAITDFYKVDARFGTNEDYRKLSEDFHKNGIKLVMDMVSNHCGSNNLIFKDLPDSTWFHFWPEYTTSNYRGTLLFDPHAAKSDVTRMTNGWFDKTMPDLNQNNPMTMKYLIQNAIWWVEYVGLDGIRMDTWPYNDKFAMQEWCKRLKTEFPDLSLLGECWLNDNPFTAYFAHNMKNLDGFTSGLDYVTDFPLTFAINKGMKEEEGWDTGITRIYQNFVSDFLQPNPENNLVFIDNHDVARIATDMQNDVNKLKIIYTIILTTRGVPCIYYGSEVKMESPHDGDGWKRQNMYGGWQGDKKSAFSITNLNSDEKEMLDFITKLANFRKTSTAFSGEMIHYVPENGVYVYFRLNGSEKVMVVINNNKDPQTLDLNRFEECLSGIRTAEDVMNNTKTDLGNSLKINGKSSLILNLK